MPSRDDTGRGAVFLTNAILCLKQGGMRAKVDPAWMENCGRLFLRPAIDLVAPRVVVTVGKQAYRARCSSYGVRPGPFRRAVAGDGFRLPAGPFLLPAYHCGARILNTHRPLPLQEQDWTRVRKALEICLAAKDLNAGKG